MVNKKLTAQFTNSRLPVNVLLGLFLFFITPGLHAASLLSEVDRNTISLGESFELNVVFNQQTLFGEPDFNGLKKDFKILNQNRQSQYSNINGRALATTRWILNLSPLREGKLLIPSFAFKGEVSNAIELTINKPTPSIQQTGKPVFTETLLEKSSVYVQEQALLTLRLYTSIPMSNFTISELRLENAQLIKVAESQYQKNIKGQGYTVVETRYAIFSETSGTLNIPAIQYSGVITDNNNHSRNSLFNQRGFGQRGKKTYFHTETKQLDVKPIPTNTTLQHWLPGKKLQFHERWSNDSPTITLGEPLTRTITITAQGLMGVQFPPLPMPSDKRYKLYPDQAQMNDSISETGVTGSRIESIAIVPTQVGNITLPDITINWWDTETNQVRQSVLKGRTFEVLPPTDTVQNIDLNPTQTTTINEDKPLLSIEKYTVNPVINIYTWLLAGGNVLLLITTSIFGFLWWRSRGNTHSMGPLQNSSVASDKDAFKNVRMTCATDNYPALRQAIITWARINWQRGNIFTLAQIAELADSDTLKSLFKDLDAALYSNQDSSHSVDSNAIFLQLEKLRKNNPTNEHKQDRRQHLQHLYPTIP